MKMFSGIVVAILLSVGFLHAEITPVVTTAGGATDIGVGTASLRGVNGDAQSEFLSVDQQPQRLPHITEGMITPIFQNHPSIIVCPLSTIATSPLHTALH